MKDVRKAVKKPFSVTRRVNYFDQKNQLKLN
ncbi:hypothetical protein cce_4080 [Crocosphaera subtropica ATCC 51142]|uniref:Uncharacterized protein n=1 Tax=Crocosphaera subtropica (strain ATCC 51142 / BH68) TaxID=43989 RepID=B1WQX6_CROS5|nr:hypothetical protein cce_4080 [Crocosphaera subtropica ATCC 51142]